MKEGEYPFGSVMDVWVKDADLVALAHVSEVMLVEPYATAVPLNDLTRTRVGVASNVTDTANLHGLTGNGVVVGVPGSGIDITHPDLANRVIIDNNSPPMTDGARNPRGRHHCEFWCHDSANFTNGSTAGSSFAGKAPLSQLYSLSILPAAGVAVVGTTNYGGGPSIMNAIVAINVTNASAGYQQPPIVTILDEHADPRITNVVGGVEFRSNDTGCRLHCRLTNGGRLAAFLKVDVIESYAISGGSLVTNYTTNIWTGSNYTETNITVLVTPPWSGLSGDHESGTAHQYLCGEQQLGDVFAGIQHPVGNLRWCACGIRCRIGKATSRSTTFSPPVTAALGRPWGRVG